jgi:hypothetical protein
MDSHGEDLAESREMKHPPIRKFISIRGPFGIKAGQAWASRSWWMTVVMAVLTVCNIARKLTARNYHGR